MNICMKSCLFIFISLICCTCNGSCGYSLSPTDDGNQNPETIAVDEYITFWDLPLWIKIAFILTLIAGFFAAVKFLPPFAGRIESILENKKRKKVMEFITENPGKSVDEIASEMNIKRDSLRYHIKRLSRGDFIVIENTDNSRRVFPNHGTFSGLERKIISMSHNPTQLKILALITKYPGIRNADLKDELGISKSAVSWHVGKIRSAGLLSCRKSGTAKHYYVRSGLERIIVENLPEELRENYGFSV